MADKMYKIAIIESNERASEYDSYDRLIEKITDWETVTEERYDDIIRAINFTKPNRGRFFSVVRIIEGVERQEVIENSIAGYEKYLANEKKKEEALIREADKKRKEAADKRKAKALQNLVKDKEAQKKLYEQLKEKFGNNP